jgi:hypothetical protein
MCDQAFLLGVAVEAGDRAQPAGDGGSSPPSALEVTPEALDVHAVHFEQPQVMARTPPGELSQV